MSPCNVFVGFWCQGYTALRFPGKLSCEESTCNAGDFVLMPGSGSSTGEGIGYPLQYSWASLVAQRVKNLPAMWETWVRSLDWKDPQRRTWQPTPVFLSVESPWTEEPGKLQSMESQRVRQDWVTKHTAYTGLIKRVNNVLSPLLPGIICVREILLFT